MDEEPGELHSDGHIITQSSEETGAAPLMQPSLGQASTKPHKPFIWYVLVAVVLVGAGGWYVSQNHSSYQPGLAYPATVPASWPTATLGNLSFSYFPGDVLTPPDNTLNTIAAARTLRTGTDWGFDYKDSTSVHVTQSSTVNTAPLDVEAKLLHWKVLDKKTVTVQGNTADIIEYTTKTKSGGVTTEDYTAYARINREKEQYTLTLSGLSVDGTPKTSDGYVNEPLDQAKVTRWGLVFSQMLSSLKFGN